MKKILISPQVIGAIITSIVASVLAFLPMIRNDSTTPIPTEIHTLTPIIEPITEQLTVMPTNEPLPIERTVIIPTSISTLTPIPTVIVPTLTSTLAPIPTVIIPTLTSTLAPIPTVTTLPATEQPPANVLLVHDDVSFTVHNQSSQTLSINTISFRSTNGNWDANKWGASLASSLPANNCLRLRDINSGQRQPPSICGNLLGLQLIDMSLLFWVNVDEFEIFSGERLIATCSTANDTCPIFVP